MFLFYRVIRSFFDDATDDGTTLSSALSPFVRPKDDFPFSLLLDRLCIQLRVRNTKMNFDLGGGDVPASKIRVAVGDGSYFPPHANLCVGHVTSKTDGRVFV